MSTIARWKIAGVVLAAGLACGCGSSVCDRSDKVDLTQKAGACAGVAGKPLGPTAQCKTGLGRCTGADQKVLDQLVTCLSSLAPCASTADSALFQREEAACYGQASGLSSACVTAIFGGVLPGPDAGSDAGVDAGLQPATDGGGALGLVAVADESTLAMAWTVLAPGPVVRWQVELEDAGASAPLSDVALGTPRFTQVVTAPDASVALDVFVAGLADGGGVAFSLPPDAGAVDAGPAQCQLPTDCPPNQECNLGTCQSQVCQDSNQCPAGYLCIPPAGGVCVRQYGLDGGAGDAGSDAGGGFVPLPLVSPLAHVVTHVPAFSGELEVSAASAANPSLAAIDSARQFVAVDQGNLPMGYLTQDRGATFTASPIDTLGAHPKVAYEPASGLLFACYNAGFGVRVRRSYDLGATWGNDALDLVNPTPADGGFPPVVDDCAIAPWQAGQAQVVTREANRLQLYAVDGTLLPPTPVTVFQAGTGYFTPANPTVATAPARQMIHVGFTASHFVTGGTLSEVLDAYQDPTTGGFATQLRVDNSTVTSPFAEDWVTVAIDPGSGKAVAAYTSSESVNGNAYLTLRVALFDPTTKIWATGNDLNVMAYDPQGQRYPVFPARMTGQNWDAFSAAFSVLPNGKILLSLVAGSNPGAGAATTYQPYVVGFDLNASSPLSTGKGWFLPPATRVSTTLVPLPSPNQLPGPVLAADGQISGYLLYIEGIGASGATLNRPLLLTRP